jgi:hypothetical protein
MFGHGHTLSHESWRLNGVVDTATMRVRRASPWSKKGLPVWFPPEPREWELLWGLASVTDFVIDEPLRTLVDQGSFLAYEFYRLIWEARFLTTENLNLHSAQDVVHSVTEWLSGSGPTGDKQGWFRAMGLRGTTPSMAQRCDLLCMLLTLAAQNDLISDFCFSFSSLEKAVVTDATLLKDLEILISTTERWIKMGSPIGVILGFDATDETLAALQEKNPKLAARVEASLKERRK